MVERSRKTIRVVECLRSADGERRANPRPGKFTAGRSVGDLLLLAVAPRVEVGGAGVLPELALPERFSGATAPRFASNTQHAGRREAAGGGGG